MKRINHQTKALLSAALLFFFSFSGSFGQTIRVNKIYRDIGSVQMTGNNEIWAVFPDSNRIYVVGQGLLQDSLSTIFTAAFDYSGSLVWKKNLSIPPALKPTVVGYHNLIKLNPNLYVVGGNLSRYPLQNGDTVSEPFLYFFDADGDSLNYVTLVDTGCNRILSTLTINPGGGLIAGGGDSNIEHGYVDPNVRLFNSRHLWFARLSDSGDLLHLGKITLDGYDNTFIIYPGFPLNTVTNIFPVEGDSIKYLIGTQSTNSSDETGNIILETDSNFQWLGRFHIGDESVGLTWCSVDPHMLADYNNYVNLLVSTSSDGSKVISYFYSEPGAFILNYPYYDDANKDALYSGTFVSRINSVFEPPMGPLGSPPGFFSLNQNKWCAAFGHSSMLDTAPPPGLPYTVFPTLGFYNRDSAFRYHNHLEFAINGDLFLDRTGVVLPDSTNPFHWSVDLSYVQPRVPYLIRMDSTDGHLKWTMPIEYNSHARDTSVKQYFNDMAVAPSGCLVMGGYVNVNHAIPGYDSLGKNSWLVVLCDSLHDHDTATGIQIPEAGSQAEFMVYPNPTPDNAFVVLKHFEGNLQDVGIQLCDFNGRVLQNLKCNSEKVWIRLSGYASGIYLIKVSYKGKPCGTVKLVKE